MTTTFDIANAADLANAIAAISVGGASAAGNTAYTFNFHNGFTLDRQLAPINLESTARLVINGNGFEMNGADTYRGFVAMSGDRPAGA